MHAHLSPDAAPILFRRRYLRGQKIVGTHDKYNFLNTSLTAYLTVAISAQGIITKEELVERKVISHQAADVWLSAFESLLIATCTVS